MEQDNSLSESVDLANKARIMWQECTAELVRTVYTERIASFPQPSALHWLSEAAYVIRFRKRRSTELIKQYDRASEEQAEIAAWAQTLKDLKANLNGTPSHPEFPVLEEIVRKIRQAEIQKIDEAISVHKLTLQAITNYRSAIEGFWGLVYPQKPFPRNGVNAAMQSF